MVISWHPEHARQSAWSKIFSPFGRGSCVGIATLAVIFVGPSLAVAQEPPAEVPALAVTLERTCYFDTVSGEMTQMAVGTYFVEIALDNSLRLHPDGSDDTIALEAEIGDHPAELMFPEVEFITDDESQTCVVALLLPRNLIVASEGSYTGVTARGDRPQYQNSQVRRSNQAQPSRLSPARTYQVASTRPNPLAIDIEILGISYPEPLSVVLRNNGGRSADVVNIECTVGGIYAEFVTDVVVDGGATRTINVYPDPPSVSIPTGAYSTTCAATLVQPSSSQDSNPSNNVLTRTIQFSEQPFDIQLTRVRLLGCGFDGPLSAEGAACADLTYNLAHDGDRLQTPWRAACWLKPVRQMSAAQIQQPEHLQTQDAHRYQTAQPRPLQPYGTRGVMPLGTRTRTGNGTSPMTGRRNYGTELNFGTLESGNYELECEIDTGNALPDTDRSDNIRSANFEVPGAPVFDLAVVDITGRIEWDGQPRVYAHVENRGNQYVHQGLIMCYRAGEELRVFVSLEPGETRSGGSPNWSPRPPVALGSRSTRCVVEGIWSPREAVDSNPSNNELTKVVVIE